MPHSAAEKALDAIAALCGCPHWEYPGQVVRDVQRLREERDEARRALREERERMRAAADVPLSMLEKGRTE